MQLAVCTSTLVYCSAPISILLFSNYTWSPCYVNLHSLRPVDVPVAVVLCQPPHCDGDQAGQQSKYSSQVLPLSPEWIFSYEVGFI